MLHSSRYVILGGEKVYTVFVSSVNDDMAMLLCQVLLQMHFLNHDFTA